MTVTKMEVIEVVWKSGILISHDGNQTTPAETIEVESRGKEAVRARVRCTVLIIGWDGGQW